MSFSPLTEELALAGAVAAAATATLLNAAFLPGSQLFGSTIVAGNDPAQVALTYDDGPNDHATSELLDLLARHNARATFFMLGKYVRQRPDLARRVAAAGHLIGNHTLTHPWLAWQPATVVREELTTCSKVLEDTLGQPVRYFRPPHGARRPLVLSVARELGMATVQWNAMGIDWEPIGADRITANVLRSLTRARRNGRGTNILLHDGGHLALGTDRSATVTATAQLLTYFSQNGLTPVTPDVWG